ncbi:MAG: CHAT domain-containing protein [Planctomycetota bacterium]|nr:CHAT domain-containing protein [Planctomycetota bacterium]
MIHPFLGIAFSVLLLAQTPAESPHAAALELGRAALATDEATPDARRARVASAVDALLAIDVAGRAPEATEALRNLGLAAYGLGDLETAARALEGELAGRERAEPREAKLIRRARGNIAVVRRGLGDLEGALAVQREILDEVERATPPDEDALTLARGNLAATLQSMRRLPEARELFELVLAAHEKRAAGGEDAELQKARINLGIVLGDMGEPRRAWELQSKALENLERLDPDDPDLPSTRNLVGGTAYELGELERARGLYEAALVGLERQFPVEHPDVQRTRLNLGLVLQDQGDLEGARAIQEGVLRVWEAQLPADHPELLLVRNHLAGTAAISGDWFAACALYEEVQTALEATQPEDSSDLQSNRLSLATARRELGDFAAALALEERVLATWSRTLPADHPHLVEARRSHSITLDIAGEASSARELRTTILADLERAYPADHPSVAKARRSLGLSLAAEGEFAAARAQLLAGAAAEAANLPLEHPDRGTSAVNLAWLAASMEDPAEIERWIRVAVERMEAVVRGLVGISAREVTARLEAESLTVRMILSLAPRLESAPALHRACFAVVESMRARDAQPTPLGVGGDDAGLARLRDARRAMNDRVASLSEATDLEAARKEMSGLVRARDEAEREVARRLHAGSSWIRVEDVATALAPDARAVAFRRYTHFERAFDRAPGEERITAFVVAPDGKLSRVDIGSEAAVEAAVVRWRSALGRPLERGLAATAEADDADAAGEALRALVLDPLEDVLGDARIVHVCLDGPLHLVPLDALPARRAAGAEAATAGLVGGRRRIVVESSFARLVSRRPPSDAAPGLLAIGGVSFNARIDGEPSAAGLASATQVEPRADAAPEPEPEVAEAASRAGPLGSNWAPLPQTRAEAERIGALFEESYDTAPVVLLGRDATKIGFQRAVAGKRFVHVATHGYFAAESVRALTLGSRGAPVSAALDTHAVVTGMAPYALCGVAFAGANRGADAHGRVPGILTAEELLSADLASCELAVLSACETNVGVARAGFGLRSLQAALHAAGARTAITSLWRVDDEATRELFEDFYVRVWVEGLDKAQALWEAKMSLRRNGRPARDWAGWILSGDPR